MNIHVYEVVNRLTGEIASFTYVGAPEPWKATDDANELLGIGHYTQWLHIVKTILWDLPTELATQVSEKASELDTVAEELAYEWGARLAFRYMLADIQALIKAVDFDGCNHDEVAYRLREKYKEV